MKIEDLEKHFQEQLIDHESFDLDPVSVWQFVDSQLKRKRRTQIIFRCLLGLAGCLLILFVSINFYSHEGVEKDLRRSIQQQVSDSSLYTGLSKVNVEIQKEPAEIKEISNSEIRLNKRDKRVWIDTFSTTFSDAPIEHSSSSIAIEKMIKKTMPQENLQASGLGFQDSVTLKNVEKLDSTILIPDLYAIAGLPLQKNSSLVIEKAVSLPNLQIIVKKDKPKFLFNLEAGPSFSTEGIQANDSPDYARIRNKSEEPQLGWGIGFNAYRLKKSGIVTGVGIEYKKSWVKFRYQWNEQGEVLLEGIPIDILIDLETMDTMGIQFGSATIHQTKNRNVQHFNEFQTFSFPLHIGFIKDRQKFSFGILGGISYNFRIKQEGRLLGEELSLIDFQKNSYFKRSNFSAHLKPMLAVKLRPDFQMTFSPSIALSLTDQIKGDLSISQRPITYSVYLGLMKTFLK